MREAEELPENQFAASARGDAAPKNPGEIRHVSGSAVKARCLHSSAAGCQLLKGRGQIRLNIQLATPRPLSPVTTIYAIRQLPLPRSDIQVRNDVQN